MIEKLDKPPKLPSKMTNISATKKAHCPVCGNLAVSTKEVRTSRKTGKPLNWFVNLVLGGLLLAYAALMIFGIVSSIMKNDTESLGIFVILGFFMGLPGALLVNTYVKGVKSPLFRCPNCRHKWTQREEESQPQKINLRSILYVLIGFGIAVILFWAGYYELSQATYYNAGESDLITGISILGITLFVVFLWLVYILRETVTLLGNKAVRVPVAFVTALFFTFFVYLSAPKSIASIKLVNELLPACSGQGVQGTATFTGRSVTQHPTVIIETANGVMKSSTSFDLDQSSLSTVQAVLCFTYSDVNLGYCNYDLISYDSNGNISSTGTKSIDLVRSDLAGKLVAAATGQTISTITLKGSDPVCPDPKDVSASSADTMTGLSASMDNVKEWLSELYNHSSP